MLMSKIKGTKIILPQEGTFSKGRLTKLKDNIFNGKHPNKIYEGHTVEGIIWQEPIVGQSCVVGDLTTSVIVEVIDEGTFKTKNSTYKIEYFE
jgi:hypothetical protein